MWGMPAGSPSGRWAHVLSSLPPAWTPPEDDVCIHVGFAARAAAQGQGKSTGLAVPAGLMHAEAELTGQATVWRTVSDR